MHEFYSHLPLNKGAMVSKRKRQTESLTLRLDKDLLDKLRKESEQKMVSINTLTNLIIKSYIKWYSPAQRAEIMSVPKSVLIAIIDNLADYQMESVADKFRKSGYEETLLMMSNEYSLPVVLDLFDSWLNVSNMQFNRESSEDSLTYIINHGVGKKWSLFLEKVFWYMVKDLGITGARFDVTESTVTIKINLKQ
ncbi:MAG: hypothetical protein QN715_09665 [Nitrososphaeraceae archaeon]|nr:hypothetical protein [Nitrososphaeraceae archaeon]MDW0301079.1 hypothetical protein [Nitrososphaeraceae archaeon]